MRIKFSLQFRFTLLYPRDMSTYIYIYLHGFPYKRRFADGGEHPSQSSFAGLELAIGNDCIYVRSVAWLAGAGLLGLSVDFTPGSFEPWSTPGSALH